LLPKLPKHPKLGCIQVNSGVIYQLFTVW